MADSETPAVEDAKAPSGPVVVKLIKPLQLTKESTIEELELKPNARAFKDFSLPMTAELKIDYQPYQLAIVGLKMAGHRASADKLVDQLDPKDMIALSQAVLSFFG